MHVDFLQHRVLTHIRVAFCKVEAERKGNANDLSEWLLDGMDGGTEGGTLLSDVWV